MKKGIYLITGFPGFLSRNIVEELISQEKASTIYMLHLDTITIEAEELAGKLAGNKGTDLILVKGDITQPDLGMSEEKIGEIRETVEYVWHLAAIYDLAVPENLAFKVNVEGTRHVNSFCKTLTD
jgi:thioester reductase-like protein